LGVRVFLRNPDILIFRTVQDGTVRSYWFMETKNVVGISIYHERPCTRPERN
jgi:hypothetical protein